MALSVLVIGICVGRNIGDMKGARVNDGDTPPDQVRTLRQWP